ncbi:MAG: hypothetical protein QXW97_03680 [Candidatus Pacearchaeota archaeon]
MSTVFETLIFKENKGVVNNIKEKCIQNWLYTAEINLPTSFDKVKRTLELRLNCVEIDEDTDNLTRLLLPITVLLIDNREDSSGKKYGYEDVYYYSGDATFISHGWRKFRVEGQKIIYEPLKYIFDGNPKKLFDEQDYISELINNSTIPGSLLEYPVIIGLKTKTLLNYHDKYFT